MSDSELPILKPRELIRVLERMGFGLVRKVLRDIELSPEELDDWL